MAVLRLAALVGLCGMALLSWCGAEGRPIYVYDRSTGSIYEVDPDTGRLPGKGVTTSGTRSSTRTTKVTTTATRSTSSKRSTTAKSTRTSTATASTTSSITSSTTSSSKTTPSKTAGRNNYQDCPAGCTISINGACYASISAAIESVPSGGTIMLSNDAVLRGETATTKDLNFVGCGTGRASVRVDMNLKDGGVVRATGNNQTITFTGLAFQGSGMSKYSSVLRTPELGDGIFPVEATTGPVALSVVDCSFTDFRTQARGGAVFFIGRASKVTLSSSSFIGNKVVTIPGKNRYEGGGAIWINHLNDECKVLDSSFIGNTHDFGHSTGAAFMILEVRPKAKVDILGSTFRNNLADSGGALYIKDMKKNSVVTIDAEFVGNQCTFTDEFGCRGGAAWIQNIAGKLILAGTYRNNEAIGDRAAVVANNRIYGTGEVVLRGSYTDNKCTKGGAVWDTLYGFHTGATLTIEAGTHIKGNAGNSKDEILRLLADKEEGGSNPRNIVRTESEWNSSGRQWTFVGGTPSTGRLES